MLPRGGGGVGWVMAIWSIKAVKIRLLGITCSYIVTKKSKLNKNF